jgi:hypothetical protein
MTETRAERAERVLKRLGVRLGSEGLVGVDVGRQLVYGVVPEGVEVGEEWAALDDEWTTDLREGDAVAYDVPTFGVTVHVFESGVVACADDADSDLAAAAVTATVTELASTPVEPSTELDIQEVSLTAGPGQEWQPAHLGGLLASEADGTGDGVSKEGTDANTVTDGDPDARSTSGVTPSPCSGCGRVPDGWERYCPRCGTDLKPETCGACGAALAPWMLYCPACGRDVAGPSG